MMHMTFYWSRYVTLLVDLWRTESWLGYSLTLLVCVFASAFYQFLENSRLRIKLIAVKPRSAATMAENEEPLLESKLGGGKWSMTVVRLAGALLYGFNSAIGYLLMLAVMSFNGGVFLAVVLGLAIGYLFFRSDDENLVLAYNSCACA